MSAEIIPFPASTPPPEDGLAVAVRVHDLIVAHLRLHGARPLDLTEALRARFGAERAARAEEWFARVYGWSVQAFAGRLAEHR